MDIGIGEEFIELYKNCNRKLYATALIILKDRQDAEDAVQDAVILAMKSFVNLKNIESFEYWILKILVNRCYRLRKMKFKFNVVDMSYDIPIEDNACDELIVLKDELLKLKYKYRVVLTLKYIDDLTIAQISEILNISEGTIKSQLHRGINKIKENLKIEGARVYAGR